MSSDCQASDISTPSSINALGSLVQRRTGEREQSDNDGMVCVIESSLSLTKIREILSDEDREVVGPGTIIFSGARATNNSVFVMRRSLYKKILSELNETSISAIAPYYVHQDNSPNVKKCQSNDLFLRFRDRTMQSKQLNNVKAEELREKLSFLMGEMVKYGIITKGTWNIELPLADRNDTEFAMNFAFIKFDKSVPVEPCVYVKAILNGHQLPDTNISIKAYWSDQGKSRNVSKSGPSGHFSARKPTSPSKKYRNHP